MDVEQKLDREVAHMFEPASKTRKRGTARQNITYDHLLSDKMLIIEAINHGVPYTLFDLIKKVTPFTSDDWATLLDLSTKSLHRYQRESRTFRSLHSERIIEIAEVAREGLDVFGDAGKFRHWLDAPSLALGNRKPIDLLRNSYGKELVLRELTHIAHGIFV